MLAFLKFPEKKLRAWKSETISLKNQSNEWCWCYCSVLLLLGESTLYLLRLITNYGIYTQITTTRCSGRRHMRKKMYKQYYRSMRGDDQYQLIKHPANPGHDQRLLPARGPCRLGTSLDKVMPSFVPRHGTRRWNLPSLLHSARRRVPNRRWSPNRDVIWDPWELLRMCGN
jgi:hypothetical protein